MRTLTLVALVVLPISAAADPDRAPRQATGAAADVSRMVTDDCALARRAGKTCVLEVPPEDVQGAAPKISEIDIRILGFGTSASLIRLRREFILEIVKTAEDL